MNHASPATDFNRLLDKAVDALFLRPTDFALRLLEKEAVAMKKADPSGSLEVRAHIAAVEDRFEDVDALYERALSISDNYIGTAVRYLMVLNGTAQGQKVFATFSRFRESLRHNPSALRASKKVLTGSGWVFTAEKLDEELERLGSKPVHATEHYTLIDEEIATEAEIAEAVIFVRQFLRKRGAQPKAVQTIVVPYEDGRSSLLFQLSIDRSPEAASSIEWDLFAALHERSLPAEVSGAIVFALTTEDAITDACH